MGRRKAKNPKYRHDLPLAGNLLDKATHSVRDAQTNGLLIGPHTSNIISELILTSVNSALLRNPDLIFHPWRYAEKLRPFHTTLYCAPGSRYKGCGVIIVPKAREPPE